MESSVVDELPALVEARFPVARDRRSIFGHSMGGHGALTLALRHPDRYRSVSAFAPICAPSRVPWGDNAFTGYLEPRSEWAAHDAVALLESHRFSGTLLVDQGLDDKFLERELRPELLEAACSSRSSSVATPATTTATSSSRRSWTRTCVTTRPR